MGLLLSLIPSLGLYDLRFVRYGKIMRNWVAGLPPQSGGPPKHEDVDKIEKKICLAFLYFPPSKSYNGSFCKKLVKKYTLYTLMYRNVLVN